MRPEALLFCVGAAVAVAGLGLLIGFTSAVHGALDDLRAYVDGRCDDLAARTGDLEDRADAGDRDPYGLGDLMPEGEDDHLVG